MGFTTPLDWMDRLRRTDDDRPILRGRWTLDVKGERWTAITNGWELVAVKADDGELAGSHVATVLPPFIAFEAGPHLVEFKAFKAFCGPPPPHMSCVCQCGHAHSRRMAIDGARWRIEVEETVRVGNAIVQRIFLALALEELSAERVFLTCEGETTALRIWAEDWRVVVMPVRLSDVERMAAPAFPLPEPAVERAR